MICALTLAIAASLCSAAFGEDAPKIDSATPVEQLKTLAADGNAAAMIEYGERLVQGIGGVETNIEEGLSWFHKAAGAGKSQAWYDIGFVYSNGLLGKPDMAEAMKYFRIGADSGSADCQTSLGLFYQAGERIPGGVKEDPAEAVKWYRLAAEQNHTEAIQHLGMMYVTGQGVAQDYAEAFKWFHKGAELGNGDCFWGLGQCYWEGKGVEKDLVQGAALFSAAIEGTENPEQKQAMTERRNELCKEFTPEQMKEADRLAAEWKAKGRSAKRQ